MDSTTPATPVTPVTPLIGQDAVWAACLAHLTRPTHLFLTGPPGSGKTTLLRAFLDCYRAHTAAQQPLESLELGPEQDRGIQTIRGPVTLFIRQMAAHRGIHRWVIIDDADTFPHISQQALRRPMETYSHITRFFFVGSAEEDLIPALRSRCVHLRMNTLDLLEHRPALLRQLSIPPTLLTEDMWSWVLTLAGSNLADLLRLLRLLRDVHHQKGSLQLPAVRMLCSAPYYLHFAPLLTAMTQRNVVQATRALLDIWKRGYMYEDILESLQQIHQLFGGDDLEHHKLLHRFLIQAWVSYCKGSTSLISLQHTLYRALTTHSSVDMEESSK